MREQLFRMLRCSIWDQFCREAIKETAFLRILSLAESQTVYGLVMEAFNDSRIDGMEDKTPLFEAIGVMEQIKQNNRDVNKELADFALICEKIGLEYIVVKGQTVGCLYKDSLLRQPGDIDFLVRVDYNDVKVRLEDALLITLPSKISEYEIGFDRNNIRYELHTKLRGWAKKCHQKTWDDLIMHEWQNEHYVVIYGSKVRTLSPTLNAAYIFIHLFFHFIREGVSLRQMCDWAVVLHNYRDEIDKDVLIHILIELDMFDAYCAFETILVDKLGLAHQELPIPIRNDDRKWQKMILEDIFRGGNFGFLNHKTHSSWKYKTETFYTALRHSYKYYKLCPSEVGGMIPRLIKGNLKILLKQEPRP